MSDVLDGRVGQPVLSFMYHGQHVVYYVSHLRDAVGCLTVSPAKSVVSERTIKMRSWVPCGNKRSRDRRGLCLNRRH